MWRTIAFGLLLLAVATSTTAADRLAVRVDALLQQRRAAAGVELAQPGSDAEFIRRASLDLTGVIPTPAEVLDFLADPAADKRTRLIDRLLASPGYATHLANTWTDMLLPPEALAERPDQVAPFTAWLRRRFADNLRYDNLVAELLTTTGGPRGAAALFYTASDLKPEELAASTSRIFLGVQIECAQCHNHPFDHWCQADFWSYAAFFARVQQTAARPDASVELLDAASGELTMPDTGDVVRPKYLGVSLPADAADSNRRRQLAIWIVSRDNPYFARVAVNRVWAKLFGRGLVHPADDFANHNPPSHPELLDELALWFVAKGCDLKALYRELANTSAYQATSATPESGEPPPELFAVMQIKTLTPNQLYDCLAKATRRVPLAAAPNGEQPAADAARAIFLARFQTGDRQTSEFQAGIPQILSMMNGPLTSEATHPDQGGLLLTLDAPFFTDEQRVESLFLATLSRLPRDEERRQFMAYVERGGSTGDRRQALGDVLWALLNSPEFILNH